MLSDDSVITFLAAYNHDSLLTRIRGVFNNMEAMTSVFDDELYTNIYHMQNTFQATQTSPIICIGSTEIGPYYWVGRCENGIEYFAGQTFKAPADGSLCCIKLFPGIVYGKTNATLSIYQIDEHEKNWNNKFVEVSKPVHKTMEGKWATFEFDGLRLHKNNKYGFRIRCSGGGMLAIAECPWLDPKYQTSGEQWTGSSLKEDGVFHKDFDLAFEAHILP